MCRELMSTPESFGDESASLHSKLQFRILKSKQLEHSIIRAYSRVSESNMAFTAKDLTYLITAPAHCDHELIHDAELIQKLKEKKPLKL